MDWPAGGTPITLYASYTDFQESGTFVSIGVIGVKGQRKSAFDLHQSRKEAIFAP